MIASWVPAMTRVGTLMDASSAVLSGRAAMARWANAIPAGVHRRMRPRTGSTMCASACAWRAQQARDHRLDDQLDGVLALHAFRHRQAVVARPGGVRACARVAQHQRADAFRRQTPQREGEVAAHREAHDGDAIDLAANRALRAPRPRNRRGSARRREAAAMRRSPTGPRGCSACRPTGPRPGGPTARRRG